MLMPTYHVSAFATFVAKALTWYTLQFNKKYETEEINFLQMGYQSYYSCCWPSV